jgi:hypothetical protein
MLRGAVLVSEDQQQDQTPESILKACFQRLFEAAALNCCLVVVVVPVSGGVHPAAGDSAEPAHAFCAAGAFGPDHLSPAISPMGAAGVDGPNSR